MNSKRSSFLADTAMIVTCICAVVTTGFLVFRTLGGVDGGARRARSGAVLSDSLWEAARSGGHVLREPVTSAPEDSTATLVVFSDFECPFCARFATSTLAGLDADFPGRVRVIFRHWPLSNHRLALPAAKAAECAGQQGRFRTFHDRLFALNDSIGLRSFARFAEDVDMPDVPKFEGCMKADDVIPSIEADKALAGAIGGSGTPTLVLDGRRLAPNEADSATVTNLVRKALDANLP